MNYKRTSEPTKDPMSLKGITWDHVRGYGPLNASVPLFEKNAGVRITWDKRSLKDFGDVPIEQLARVYDLIILDHPHMGAAASSHCILPLEDIIAAAHYSMMRKNSIGPSYPSYRYHGKQWALPIDAACQVSAYRSEFVKHYPVPKTWKDVFSTARLLEKERKYVGMALCPTDCNASFLTFCAQQGEAWTECKGPSDGIAHQALDLLRKLYRVSHPDSAYWNPINLYDYMTSADEVLYTPLAFGYINYTQPKFTKTTLTFGTIPGISSALLGGAGIAVSSYCQNITAAAQYLTWICGADFQSTTYVDTGGQPAHNAAWINDAANKKTNNFFLNTLPSMENAYVRPRSLHWPEFQEKLGNILHAFLIEKKDIESTWKKVSDWYRDYKTNP